MFLQWFSGFTIEFAGAFIFGFILLYILAKLIFGPIKLVIRLCVSAILGGLLLIIVNYIGAGFDFHIPLNPITALVAGILGVPGVVLLALIELFVV